MLCYELFTAVFTGVEGEREGKWSWMRSKTKGNLILKIHQWICADIMQIQWVFCESVNECRILITADFPLHFQPYQIQLKLLKLTPKVHTVCQKNVWYFF